MMRTLTLLATALAFTFVFAGCKDDDKNLSKKEIIVGGRWKVTAFTIDPAISFGGSNVTNLFAQELFYPTYLKDDVTLFTNDGKYSIEEGAQKPTPTSPAIKETGTWVLSSDEKSIQLTSSTNEVNNLVIISISKNEIKGTTPLTFTGDPVTYTGTVTYTN
jgi:hypothetical protein